tara:strand:+ start:823 stop:1065 length:243 start_codon:yes stop_codon:yes gene_type:complete
MKTQSSKNLKLQQSKIQNLLNEITSPYYQLEVISNLIKDIRDKDSKKHIMDQYLDIFENNLDEIQENLNNIVYFDPTPQN